MSKQRFEIRDPIFIMFRTADDRLQCRVHKPAEWDHRAYGIAICDLVRHAANALNVDEEDIWHWVDKERDRPTTKIIQLS